MMAVFFIIDPSPTFIAGGGGDENSLITCATRRAIINYEAGGEG